MTTVLRRPFATRQIEPTWSNNTVSPTTFSLCQSASATSNKRPHSPDVNEPNNAKKAKSTPSRSPARIMPLAGDVDAQRTIQDVRDAKDRKDKLQRREQREQANKEFLTRYTKAFPTFVFYFDDRDGSRQHAESRVLMLGASIEHFFSAAVTHVITNRPQPPKNEQCDVSNKENTASRQVAKILRSPIELKARSQDHGGYDKLVRDAVQLHKKIWSVSKLENILSRLVPSTSASSKTKSSQHSTQLNQLLHHERLHGTTSERDPRERRHDYQYFSKYSYFFLVEDIYSEIAPIAIMEYPGPNRPTEKEREPSYPVLYMDYRARSPFIKYDEKESRRLNKIETTEKLKEIERDKLRTKVKQQLKQQHEENRRKTKNLRRCASISRVGIQVINRADLRKPDVKESGSAVGLSSSIGFTGDIGKHEVASGFGQSATGQSTGYLAASGNSVSITSTTTSLVRGLGSGLRLPTSLREQLARHVVTNRRLETIFMSEPRLRKAKSTTTMRLPTRQESKKPGYCEACRIKFEDFKSHIHGSRHRKFAQNENNYIDLDFLLRRLERRPNADDSEAMPPLNKFNEAFDTCLGPGDYFYVPPDMQGSGEEEEAACETPDHD